jgi:TonB family protein
MRRFVLPVLSIAALVCATALQGIAQSTDANSSLTSVALTKLAPLSYPLAARQARIQGEVQITVGVRQDGSVESAILASGHPFLAIAALQNAKDSEYECRRCGQQVTSYSLVYSFRLEVPNPSQSQTIPLTQVENHVTVIGEPPTVTVEIVDPASSFRARSAKCLYLWKCGLR